MPKGIGGIENNANLISGAVNPTSPAHCHLQKNAQINTGMCIGHSMLPIAGICPVKNGSISAAARQSDESVRSLITVLKLFII
jgi:hypothetical protein